MEIHKFHTWSSEPQVVKPENKGVWYEIKKNNKIMHTNPKGKAPATPMPFNHHQHGMSLATRVLNNNLRKEF